jgi:glucose/arabinose dehydrogenase
VKPQRPDLVAKAVKPDYALGSHVAALGLVFSKNPEGAFVGEHGSWNRSPLAGYKVVFVPFAANGFPTPGAKPVDVLTGFLSADGDTIYGRPVGVATSPTEGLLVADDVGDTIWRVIRN